VERLTAAVVELMDELGLERPHLAGHSLGGAIALELGRMGRARSVTAIAPIGFWTKRERRYERQLFRLSVGALRARPEQTIRSMRNPVARTLQTWHLCARPWRMSPEEVQQRVTSLYRSPGFDATLEAHLEYRFRDGQEIDVPVTVAWGDLDFVLLSRQRHRAERALPQARHVTLRRCGHVPHLDDRDAVTAVLLEGCQSVAPSRKRAVRMPASSAGELSQSGSETN
jgi:pimeloyl-ACP methyl ester carboxylesterase